MFLPVMAGFLLGRLAVGASHPPAVPLYAGASPDCRDRPRPANCPGGGAGGAHSTFLYSSHGYYGTGSVGSPGSSAVMLSRPASVAPAFAPSAARGAVSSPSVSRGGFGATAAAHAGGGE